ncbi:hypothetical protein ACRAWF_21200 [Streptomyces sp. L7]
MKDFAQNPHVKGTRLTFHRPQDRNWMIDGTNDWYWPIAEDLRIPTMVHAPIWKRELGEIAAKHSRAEDHHRPHGHHVARCCRRRDRLLGLGDRRPGRPPQHLREGLGAPGATPPSPSRTTTSRSTCARWSTRWARSAASTARTSRGCSVTASPTPTRSSSSPSTGTSRPRSLNGSWAAESPRS